MSEHDLKFFYEPISISNIRNRKIIKSFFAITYFSFTRAPLFFTSLTPLQNFIKINPFKTNLKILTNNYYIHGYPPLSAGKNDWTAQYEHTVYISDNDKIIFSRGEDY